jgi:GPH family glycoside/pentoside/hexuronide:cation symporter
LKQLYDGFSDPLIGRLSDIIPTRWGRRKPWIVITIIPSAIVWALTWWCPKWLDDDELYRVIYFVSILLIFNTLNSTVSVPYYSILPDVAPDYHERTKMVFFQQVFGLTASLIFSFLQTSILDYVGTSTLSSYRKGYLISAAISAPCIAIPGLISVLFVKERLDLDAVEETESKSCIGDFFMGIWEFIKEVFAVLIFKEYMMVVSVFVLSFLAIYFTVNNLYMFIQYVVVEEKHANFVILAFQVC